MSADLKIDDSSGIKLYDIEGNVLDGDPCAYQPIAIAAEITNEGAKTDVGFDVKMEDLNDSSVHGTRLYNVEQDLRFVQDQLGHASPTTTAMYVKTNSKARKRQVEALDGE